MNETLQIIALKLSHDIWGTDHWHRNEVCRLIADELKVSQGMVYGWVYLGYHIKEKYRKRIKELYDEVIEREEKDVVSIRK